MACRPAKVAVDLVLQITRETRFRNCTLEYGFVKLGAVVGSLLDFDILRMFGRTLTYALGSRAVVLVVLVVLAVLY